MCNDYDMFSYYKLIISLYCFRENSVEIIAEKIKIKKMLRTTPCISAFNKGYV
jgi:hypothetical protein